jgi:hypothetical protein
LLRDFAASAGSAKVTINRRIVGALLPPAAATFPATSGSIPPGSSSA